MGIAASIRDAIGGKGATEGTRVRAVWNDTVIADSDQTVIVESNHYFPPDSVQRQHLVPSDHSSVCPWKGTAAYSDIVVDGERNPGAAWHYPTPSAAASHIADHLAFWRGVWVEPVPTD